MAPDSREPHDGDSFPSNANDHVGLSSSIYCPLNNDLEEIRLLVVHPGTGMDRVECSFDYCRFLSEMKPYETVSYVWGDPSIRKTIRVDGRNLDVPASSERALRRFRHPAGRRALWIDAVCINQADDFERASQVAMMDNIYGSGSCNLIWLGEGNQSTSIALNCIHRIVEEMRDETRNFSKAQEILYNSHAKFSTTGLKLSPTKREIEGLLQFYSNEWFTRLWVLQEAALSDISSCFVGGASCSLLSVLRAALWLRYKTYHLPVRLNQNSGMSNARDMFDYCDRDIGYYSQEIRYSDLQGTMILTRGFQTSDARDHVFAILGILRKFSKLKPDLEIPLPDYQKCVSEIFSNAAMYCIFDRENLDILGDVLHCRGEIRSPGLSSWVPDWATACNPATDPSFMSIAEFDACGSQALELQLLRDSSTLRLRVEGFQVDFVTLCSHVISSKSGGNLWSTRPVDIVKDSFDGIESLNCLFPEHGTHLAMTVTGGTNYQTNRWANSACEEAYETHDRLVGCEGVPSFAGLTPLSTADERLAAEFGQAVFEVLVNRRLFVSREHGLGVGSPTMEPGDIIVILYGCKAPAILRRLPNNDEYEFVGLCYIHGIMDGEAVEEHRAAGRADAIFTLV